MRTHTVAGHTVFVTARYELNSIEDRPNTRIRPTAPATRSRDRVAIAFCACDDKVVLHVTDEPSDSDDCIPVRRDRDAPAAGSVRVRVVDGRAVRTGNIARIRVLHTGHIPGHDLAIMVETTNFAPSAWMYRGRVHMSREAAAWATAYALAAHGIGDPPREALALLFADATPAIHECIFAYVKQNSCFDMDGNNQFVPWNTLGKKLEQ